MKSTPPIAFPGDLVLVENHTSKSKPVVQGKIVTTRSVWSGPDYVIHQYKVRLEKANSAGKRIVLDVQDRRIKQVISGRTSKKTANEITK